MGYVTVQGFNEKEAFLASWPTCLAWYGLKPSEFAMKPLTIETARCDLPYASSSRPHAANSSDFAPLPFQPFETRPEGRWLLPASAARGRCDAKVVFNDALASG